MRVAVREGAMWARRGFQIWTFFAVVLVVLIGATVVGTQSVHAAACTTQQCTDASDYADQVCANRSSFVDVFRCPSNSPEFDDFYFHCDDGYFGLHDCSNVYNPS